MAGENNRARSFAQDRRDRHYPLPIDKQWLDTIRIFLKRSIKTCRALIASYLSDMTDLVTQAERFASERHASQTYGERPYTYHLACVVRVLVRFGVEDDELIAAAWLHDVIEDTDTRYEDVAAAHGERVAEIVWALTDGDGATRAERKAHAYRKIRVTPGAAVVKVADRIANCEEAGKLSMYRNEHPTFRDVVASAAPGAMLEHLDALLHLALEPA